MQELPAGLVKKSTFCGSRPVADPSCPPLPFQSWSLWTLGEFSRTFQELHEVLSLVKTRRTEALMREDSGCCEAPAVEARLAFECAGCSRKLMSSVFHQCLPEMWDF